MEHSHSYSYNSKMGNAFKIGITLNIIFVAVEAFIGFSSNSMALVADAGHNLSDVLALVFSWIALILSQRLPTLKFTYGFRRSTIQIALLNTILLLAAVAYIIYETITRLKNPVEVNAISVMSVASIGIIVNGFTAWLFLKGTKHDLNVRSAFIHFMADALVSFGVVVAGIIIALTGLQWIDALVSFAIIIVILYSSFHLLMDSVSLALDAVPENIDIKEVKSYLENLPEVTGVHDLHIWALGTNDAAITVHLSTKLPTDVKFIKAIQQELNNRFSIGHATIQVEFGSDKECGIEF